MERPCACGDSTLIAYGRDSDFVNVTTEAQVVRFLLISGTPLHEPVAWY